MKKKIFLLRSKLANFLIKLAIKIRPKEELGFIQSIQDSFLYGTGVTRINPEEMFGKNKQKEIMSTEVSSITPETIDKRVLDYLERAIKLVNENGYRDNTSSVIEIAKMIQIEENKQQNYYKGKVNYERKKTR